MSTTTGQKAHRRNMSIGGISTSDSTENLLVTLPIQQVDNTRQYASQQNLLPEPPKNQTPNIFPIIKEKTTIISPSYDPFSTKKRRKPDGSFFNPKSSGLDTRKILLFFIFLWALVVFLCSLCGIGPVDEELLAYKDVTINAHDNIINETVIDDNKDSPNEEIDSLEEIAQDNSENTSDEENITEDVSSISENIISAQDDIVDIKDKLVSSDNSIITNKLKKKKQTKYEVNGALNEDNIIIDYSNYTYVITKPHFTHVDVVESLSINEQEEFVGLQISQKNTDDSLDHSCGSWQDKYTKLHEQILNGTAPQRYIGYICEAKVNCGGLADRILGMASTFLFALLTNRAFLADWQVPLPLDVIFDSPNIDWSYDSLDPDYPIEDTTELNIIDYDLKNLDYHFSLSNWTTRYPEPFIKFYTNQGLIQRAFDSKYYSSKLKEIGLRPHTAFGCFLDYLFRPAPSALSFITQYTALFALPSIFSIGIHIRTGDTYEQSYSLQDYNHFFRCADQLTQTYAAPDQKVIYYLVTDSLKLRAEAYTKLEHVIISGLPIDPGHGHYDYVDGVNNAIVENSILSKTDYRVISRGSFGKLAAFHSKQLHSTVSLDTTETKFLDCTREDAFTTFNQLANEWSTI